MTAQKTHETIRKSFKRKFVTGLVVTIPILITVLVIERFFTFLDNLLEPVYFRIFNFHIPGIGFLTAIIIIFFIGVISTNIIGKKILQFADGLFQKIPLFKSIYNALRQITDAFSPESKSSFKRFVIVEYPRKGLYAFGFLTKELRVGDNEEERFYTVYIPTNNLYLGEIVILKEKDVVFTDISIEDGVKIILSGGIATPEKIRCLYKNKDKEKVL